MGFVEIVPIMWGRRWLVSTTNFDQSNLMIIDHPFFVGKGELKGVGSA